MNWLTNFVRPRIKRLVQPREAPDNLWHKCPGCSEMVFHRELEKSLRVCPHCDHHMRLPVRQRLEILFDNKKWTEIELPSVAVDPLKFKDRKKYSDRLKDAQSKTGSKDAIVVAHGTMGGINVVIAAFEFSFLGGSMGTAVGEGIVAAAELAVLQEAPLIVIPSSGGARMQEGILSLMQMARTTVAVDRVREKGLPYVVLLTDPTTGGVTASFAMLGDIQIAEPGAIIGFAGARVIEQTIRETLPEGFQRAEYLLEHGMVDMVVHRSELHDSLVQLLGLLLHRDPAAPVLTLDSSDRKRRRSRTKQDAERLLASPPDPSIPDESLFETEDEDGSDKS
ncbi:MAG: acetyl-CoA carboxylase carboxyltransferase subunit beta [Rhodospirillaceae bacterium]|jgi:acetyl-CoA carboxylase carboxyl transferase subunit beta|nr:acetyl-CoA carboxylase carboxyltransferase subunit beta [Rhodospirillaceae bacterium]MBT5242024.1 acetyl-CoA carboxylase carboxyltransferase subunit beta [Rhodospirillaceae bacterium]MBT5565749.1 acetyl-CoA carboxylase carboxyltransferase subunit beta [Rhodospirillaceae bacterium]MBT6088524.1 acetyl-CoA carboxylase carboxyltransferase subunit beta [Rhodospirillaceae bacterium]MBT6960857.1 acetyl-CoA carboxylase carboxyltransferase subunit beta [Rhodospirillaceae bacterium]